MEFAKKRFSCRYRSSGEVYTASIRAQDAAGAAELMRAIRWAPGCGPIGEPVECSDKPYVFADAVADFLSAVRVAVTGHPAASRGEDGRNALPL